MDFGIFLTMVSSMVLVHPRPPYSNTFTFFNWGLLVAMFHPRNVKFRLRDLDLVNNRKFTTTWSGQPRLEVTWTKEDGWDYYFVPTHFNILLVKDLANNTYVCWWCCTRVAITHFQGLAPNRLLGGGGGGWSSSTMDGDVTPNVIVH